MAEQPTLHVKEPSEEHIEAESKSDEVIQRGHDPKLFVDPSDIKKLLCLIPMQMGSEGGSGSFMYPARR